MTKTSILSFPAVQKNLGLAWFIASAVRPYFCFVKTRISSLPLASCVRFLGSILLNKYSNGLWDSVFKCMADFTNVYGLPLFVCFWGFLGLVSEKMQDSSYLLGRRWDFFAAYWCNGIKRMSGTSRAGLLKMKNVYAKCGTFWRTRDL